MPKCEHLEGKRVKFGDGQDPTKGGRKKKIYTILKEKGYSKDDITTAFGEIGWYNLEELHTTSNDETKPIIARIIANQFISAFENSDWYKIKDILEHTIGRPVQKSEVTGKDGTAIELNNGVDWNKLDVDTLRTILETIKPEK
ncbi:MAG: hypothetical protein AAGG68_14820 [Bacteroidota bacterium]